MKLAYQYMAIFFNFYPTSNHLHPLQVEKCDSSSRLVVDEEDNSKFRLTGKRWWSLCISTQIKMKWNESGFRPPLCTYRLNWARRTSWGWWDDWDDTVLQTQDSKFEPWRSEAEHATSRSRRLPTILTFTRGWGRNILISFKPPRPGTEPWALAWKAAVLTTTLGPPPVLVHVLLVLSQQTRDVEQMLGNVGAASQTVTQH